MTITVPPNPRPTAGKRISGGITIRPAHLTTLVQQVERKVGDSHIIVVQTPGTWAGGDRLSIGDQTWRVVRAGSVLAIREALAEHEEAEPARLIVLTPLGTQDLGWDVLARIARQRAWALESWDLLQDLFRARGIDPRVTSVGWLADVLLEYAPPGGYAPTPSGVLDLNTAWMHALGALLSMPDGGAPDALTVLRWSTRDGATERWAALKPEIRSGIGTRWGETAGRLGQILSAAIDAGRGEQLVALGLVCGVLWPVEAVSDGALHETITAARVRLEPLVGGAALSERAAQDWAGLARRLLTELPAGRALAERARAERLLTELRADAAVVLSSVLPTGAIRRATHLGRTISTWLASGGSIEAVETAQQWFVLHEEIQGTARAERSLMAARTVRALSGISAEAAAESFGGRVRFHVRSGSWLDAARASLMAGEPEGELSTAYSALLRRARERREVENRRFAEGLAAWNIQPVTDADVIPVERVIEQLVAPVADMRPVLVVLLDALDLVVWRQLYADLAVHGWTWWQPERADVAPVAIAMLPSVTTFSRASLFAGQPTSGAQGQEQDQFLTHPSLLRSVVGGRRPLLFHKADLGSTNGLTPAVRRAISDRQQRVIGVVINAVDDWLAKSDQVMPHWSIADVPLLEALLQEATLAGRAVIVLSDHGHLLDHDTTLERGGEGSRWRQLASSAAGSGEIMVSGSRVRAVVGHDAVVLAYSEALRYAGKKTGYHGGATPQEVIAPIGVLSRDDLGLAGWRPVLDVAPLWWDGSGTASVTTSFRRDGVRSFVPTPSMSAGIIEPPPTPTTRARTGTYTPSPWVHEILVTPAYRSQRDLAGRTAPRDEQIRTLLETLDRYQGRAPRAAVASALGLSDMRVRGVLAGARRVLNVEGFAVLEEEVATGVLMLNRDLLRMQFGLAR